MSRIGRIFIPEIGVDFSIDWHRLIAMQKRGLMIEMHLSTGQILTTSAPTPDQLHALYDIIHEQWKIGEYTKD
jgi:hypothetical protein